MSVSTSKNVLDISNTVFQFLFSCSSSDVFFHFNGCYLEAIWTMRLGWEGNGLTRCVSRISQFFKPGGLTNLQLSYLHIIDTFWGGLLCSPFFKLPPCLSLLWSLKIPTYFYLYGICICDIYFYYLSYLQFLVCLLPLKCKFHEDWKLYFFLWCISGIENSACHIVVAQQIFVEWMHDWECAAFLGFAINVLLANNCKL